MQLTVLLITTLSALAAARNLIYEGNCKKAECSLVERAEVQNSLLALCEKHTSLPKWFWEGDFDGGHFHFKYTCLCVKPDTTTGTRGTKFGRAQLRLEGDERAGCNQ
ncbi:Hypothetical protein D9617_6g095370 [Elsinoe fawcettii]|nr:Hypothetical protein D9617_6g095370 [Elsinoe fawcettii]